jgi:hypothetical protein
MEKPSASGSLLQSLSPEQFARISQLLDDSGFVDVPRAIQLYQQAWEQGVRIAGFALAALYEYAAMLHSSTMPPPPSGRAARTGRRARGDTGAIAARRSHDCSRAQA